MRNELSIKGQWRAFRNNINHDGAVAKYTGCRRRWLLFKWLSSFNVVIDIEILVYEHTTSFLYIWICVVLYIHIGRINFVAGAQ